MSNAYTQIHIQAVFAVQYRQSLINERWEEELYKYITGIIQKNNHKLLAINGMPDHIHILFGLRPSQSISDLLQDIKGDSAKWINKNGFTSRTFSWQKGYGAFSYRKKDVPEIIKYITNQKIHHQKKKFKDEYREILQDFEVEFDERFLLEPVEYVVPKGTI